MSVRWNISARPIKAVSYSIKFDLRLLLVARLSEKYQPDDEMRVSGEIQRLSVKNVQSKMCNAVTEGE